MTGDYNSAESKVFHSYRARPALSSSSPERPYRSVLKTIVIDPGHGGKRPGAFWVSSNGWILWEKYVTLDIARRLKRALKGKTSARIVLTRTRDKRVSTQARTKLANRLKADIFVSIHANSGKPSAHGVETFFASPYARPRKKRGKRRDRNLLSTIFNDLKRSRIRRQSVRLGQIIQQHLVKAYSTRDRGLRQARRPDLILRWPEMPAALVEVGFLSHEKEGAKLARRSIRKRIARALAKAILQYEKMLAIEYGLASKISRRP